MLGNCIENVRKNVPLVHNITNYVTVNDVANVLLACGGSKGNHFNLRRAEYQHWYFEQKKY